MPIKKFITEDLNKNTVKSIILLKKNYWDFNLKSQYLWFKKNAFKKDLHFMFYIKKDLIGYVHLGKRSFFEIKKKEIGKKKEYILFRNLIVKDSFREKGIASKIMTSVNNYLKKVKKTSFLICKKKTIKFYKKNNWSNIIKSNFVIKDHSHKLYAMTYPSLSKKNIKKYNFYYNK